MLWNARSIKNKLFYFQSLIYAKSTSIIAITETWLLPQILNNEIIPAGYQIFRRDRINGIGGGILLAISNSLHSHSYICSQTSEFLLVQIERNPPLLCGCAYTPPQSPPSLYHDIFTSLSPLCNENSILLLGDFNQPDISWNTLSSSSPSGITLCNQLFDLNLSQVISESTCIHGSECPECQQSEL